MRVQDMSPAQLMRAATRRRINEQYMVNANRGLGSRLDAITKRYPHINAATAMALAEQGYGPDSVEVATVGRLQKDKDESDGWWGNIKRHFEESVEGTAKPTTRVGLTALGAPYEAVQAFGRVAIEGAEKYRTGGLMAANRYLEREGSLGDMFNQTRLGSAFQVADEADISVAQALNNLPQMGTDRDPANLIAREQNTWLSGPNSLAEKRQVANARNAGTTNGRATTFGRAAGWIVGVAPGGHSNELMHRYFRMSNNPMWDDPDNIDRLLAGAQTVLEGSVDAAAALSPLDPVGKISGARTRQVTEGLAGAGRRVALDGGVPRIVTGRAGKFAGDTTDVTHITGGRPFTEEVVIDGVPLTASGVRKTIVYKNAEDWIMRSDGGDKFAKYLANETDYNRLAAVVGRSTKPQAVLRLLEASTPADAKKAMLEVVGDGFIDRTPGLTAADMSAVGVGANRVASIASATLRRPTSRWRQLAPSEVVVSRSDPAWAVEQYRRMLHAMQKGAAKDVLTNDYISRNVEEFARGVVDEDGDWSTPYLAATNAAYTALRAHGVKRGHAENLTRIWQERIFSERNYWIDRHTGAVKDAFVTVDADDMPMARAAASAEMFTEGIPLLNTQEFARAASRMNRLYASKGWDAAVSLGDASTAFFKFMVLPVRGPAWAIRNVAEAQGRITVEGLPGMFNKPLHTLGWRLGDNPRSDLSRRLGRMDRMERHGIGQFDSAGDDFRLHAEMEGNASQFIKTQEHKGGPWHDDNQMVYANNLGVARKPREGVQRPGAEDEIVDRGWDTWLDGNRFTLAKLSSSPEYRMAVDAETPLHAKNMFWKSSIRAKMANREPSLNTREGADAFMDKVYQRIDEATGGNPALREAVGTGRIDGVPLVARDARGNMTYNPKALAKLEQHADDLPEYTVAPISVQARGVKGGLAKGAEVADRMVFTGLFHLFGSMPNNRFVNSPTFRQFHWREAERLLPLANESARAQVIANARKARMPKDTIARLEAIKGPGGQLDVEDIRDLADAKAFQRWMDVVYNSHNKGNWTRSVRMISPFAAAVADMYRFWGKRLARNPLVLHRVDQGMHAARQSGFVFNDENGEERFAYPLTRSMSLITTGIDRTFTGSVKGANMITSSVLPGVGPIVSWPVGLFLPDQPETDAIREIINPYGDPDASGGIFEGFAPSHVQRMLAAVGLGSPEQQRRYTESVADAMAYLASTGKYGKGENEQRRLREDAKSRGRALYLIQAFAQGGLPASPRGETAFKDKTGRVWQIAHIAADYRRMMNEDPDTATRNLLAKYGDSVFLAVTGGTDSNGAFTTEAAHDLAREHPEIVEKYGQVWSFFTDEDSPYSHEEYRRQITSGERIPRDMRRRQVVAQTALANSMYWQYKRQFGPFPETDEQGTRAEKLQYLRDVKAALRKEFPLWDETFNANEVQGRVKQTFKAARDPLFRETKVAEAIRAYQQARAQVRDYYNEQGVTRSDSGWGRAKDAEEGRDYLRQVAASLVDWAPGFETFWERVFDSEMVDDVKETP